MRENNAPVSSHRDSHYGIEAWGDPLENTRHSPDEIGNRRVRFEAHPFYAEFAFLVTDDKEFQIFAFEVTDLSSELAGREILNPPSSPSDGVCVAFIVENGAPIELLEFTDPNTQPVYRTNDFWEITVPNKLLVSSSNHNALRNTFFACLIRKGAPVLFSSRKVADLFDPSLRQKRKSLEKHHLFPKHYLLPECNL